MNFRPFVALILAVTMPCIAAQQNSLEQFRTTRPKPIESRVPAMKAFTDPATTPKPSISKTKVTLILLGVGAAAAAVFFATRNSSSHKGGAVDLSSQTGLGPSPASTPSSIVVINGVVQP